MKQVYLLTALLLISNIVSAVTNPKIKVRYSKPSEWVKSINIDPNSKPATTKGESTYLLYSNQKNYVADQYYIKTAIRLNNENGVQNNSELWLSFDPTYQELIIHSISLYRNGKKINALKKEKIDISKNETSADRFIYNGLYSAMIIIEDVRVGDVLEYEYTVSGKNPILKDRILSEVQLSYGIHIKHMYNSVLVDNNRKIFSKGNNRNCPLPKITKSSDGKQTKYEWSLKDVEPVYTDSNLPSWYSPYYKYILSDFRSWNEVKTWEKELYTMPDKLSKDFISLTKKVAGKGSDKEKISNLLRFVQNSIRYLGIESGINSLKPHDPEKILNQRFGDCKDKSFLLHVMLNIVGIESDIAFVNSYKRGHIKDYLPSPFAFNHAILKVKCNSKIYWFDTTLSQQYGDIDNEYIPNYQLALSLDTNIKKLEEIPTFKDNKVIIKEQYTVHNTDSVADFTVESEYYGYEANNMRGSFTNRTREAVENGFLDFYSSNYPNIDWQQDSITINDNKNLNKFCLKEHYRIPDLCNKSKDSSKTTIEIEPVNLYSFLSTSSDRIRTMPMKLYHPIDIEYEMTLKVSDFNMDLEPESIVIKNDNIYFSLNIKPNGDSVKHTYRYKTLKDHVLPEETKQYFKDLEQLYNICTHAYDMDNNETPVKDNVNWIVIAVMIIAFIPMAKVYKRLYNLNVGNNSTQLVPRKIGGWLIILIIGIISSVLVEVITIYNEGFLGMNLWINYYNSYPDNFSLYALIIGAIIFINIAIVGLQVLILILIFKRRNCVPKLYISYIIITVAFSVIVYFTLNMFFGIKDADHNGMLKYIIIACIWVPYFTNSKRVKATFLVSSNS